MDAVRQRLAQHDAQIDALQQLGRTINEKLDTLIRTVPTRAGLWGMVAMVIAIAVVALFVGVLTYLQAFHPAASPSPAPIVIQVPASPSPATPPLKPHP